MLAFLTLAKFPEQDLRYTTRSLFCVHRTHKSKARIPAPDMSEPSVNLIVRCAEGKGRGEPNLKFRILQWSLESLNRLTVACLIEIITYCAYVYSLHAFPHACVRMYDLASLKISHHQQWHCACSWKGRQCRRIFRHKFHQRYGVGALTLYRSREGRVSESCQVSHQETLCSFQAWGLEQPWATVNCLNWL